MSLSYVVRKELDGRRWELDGRKLEDKEGEEMRCDEII